MRDDLTRLVRIKLAERPRANHSDSQVRRITCRLFPDDNWPPFGHV